jgi:hypothetical protein
MQHRLDIAYDDYLYETSWSLRVSRPVLLLAASGFNEVIEFGSLSQFASLLLANATCLTYDSVAGCMCFTQRWTILTCSSRQAAIRQS